MADTVKNIFNPPKPKGPDPELIAAQRRQQERLDSRDAEEERKRKAREQVLAARRQGAQNPFDTETGVEPTTLGG